MKFKYSLFFTWLGLFLFFSSGIIEGGTPRNTLAIPPCPAPFLMDALVDNGGTLWTVSENQGVWRLTSTGAWEQMNLKPGFPDTLNCYAITQDRQGLIWVGTDNQGVAIWNGAAWKHYDRLNGPQGERIFDIQVNPADGTVAMATSSGLCFYHPEHQTWTPVTRAEGLQEDQVESLAFTPQGGLYIAYQCGGVSYCPPGKNYRQWTHVQTRWYWDEGQRVRQPVEPFGYGLPSNLCNAVIAPDAKTTWVATTCGLARRRGPQWIFTRGKDYKAKNKGIYQGMPSGCKSSGKPPVTIPPDLLPEDYVTALHACPEGIWLGFREQGAVLLDADTMQIKGKAEQLNKSKNPRAKWIKNFVTLPSGDIYAATNGGGMQYVGRTEARPSILSGGKPTAFPKELPPVTEKDLEEMLARTSTSAGKDRPLFCGYYGEDWATRGDWIGRYGWNYAILCALNAPDSVSFPRTRHPYGNTSSIRDIDIRGYIGRHKTHDDSIRSWCHWFNKPYNRNVLYCPDTATRTEAEWDDHGEAYARTHDGPDLWIVFDIPDGLHELSLYFYNPNGREGNAGYRDYLVELRQWKSQFLSPGNFSLKYQAKYIPNEDPDDPFGAPDVEHQNRFIKHFNGRVDELQFMHRPPVLARCRVSHFAGSGVYKSFLVTGPSTFTLRVLRNSSFNTIVNGVFVSDLTGKSSSRPVFTYTEPYASSDCFMYADEKLPMKAVNLWSRYLPLPGITKQRMLQSKYGLLQAFRYLDNKKEDTPVGQQKKTSLLRQWSFQTRFWDSELRQEFDEVCKRDWDHMQDQHIERRSAEWRPYSPNVLPLSADELRLMENLKINWRDYLPGSGRAAMSLEELKQYLKQHKK